MNDESIFNAALRKSDPAERAAFLNQACANDAEMRARVEALLGAHAAAGSFLAPPPAANIDTITLAPRSEATSPPPVVECPGTRIGPYKLLQQIGEGGMGTVWMAEQMEPVRRNVALKIVKAGLDSSQVIARFEAERQALALMDHPNIARVLDAGSTASGRPFFVMELVKGAPITKYCDDHKLSVRQRLELFIPVCLALQHAHQKGIIHRDIKPSNVLVAPYDGKPVVKVIDFGVAKATGQRLTEKTMFTQFGAIIGTLEYMSPEQAELNNQDIDTRSDIYALGVLLYELLTGTTPLDMQRLRGAAFAAILMQIQENEPPRPSTRLSESRETLAMISAQRQTEPARLAKLMRGELDWIVMKALDKDRSRRYDTAGNLARDIEHHLREEPVEAGPPSATYRLRKLLRRNRGAVAAAIFILLALVGGATAATWGLVRANRALDAEAEQRRQAELARGEEARARNAAEADRLVATSARDAAGRARDDAERALYFNRVNLAYQYWLGDHLDQSSRILDLCPPAQRGWEWKYLNQLHHADLLSLPGNGQFTTQLHFSKDGKRLAAFASSGDAGVRIWDLSSNKALAEISVLQNHRPFSCAALAADGKIVALGDGTGAITFWQADTGQFVREFAAMKKSVSSLSFSPDGRWLAATRADGRNGEMLDPRQEPPRNEDLVVWDLASGKEVFHPKGYGFIARFSPDGSRLLTFLKNSGLRLVPQTPEFFLALFDTSTWTEVAHGQRQPASVAFSGDGKRLAVAGDDRLKKQLFLQIIDPADGKELSALTPGKIGDVALNHDGTTLCIAQRLGSSQIELWNVKDRRQTGTLRGHTDSLNAIEFSPDGRLASCSWDKTIKFWDTNSAQGMRQLAAARGLQAAPAALSPDGGVLAFGQENTVNRFFGPIRTVLLVDALTGRLMHTLDGHEDGAHALAFNANGSRLASGGRMGDVKIWDVASGTLIRTIPGKKEFVSGLALSPDGRLVAVFHEPKEITAAQFGRAQFKDIPVPIELFSADTGELRFTLPGHSAGAIKLTFSPDGKLLFSTGYQTGKPLFARTGKIWDLSTGTLLRELEQSDFKSGIQDALVVSKSGKWLAIADARTIQLWDVASGRSVAIFEGHAFGKLSVAISPDEARLASAGGREVKIWDAATGQEILSLSLPALGPQKGYDRIESLAWSADGQRLRAALSDGSVVEWSASRP